MRRTISFLSVAIVLTACGGGSSSDDPMSNANINTNTDGTATAGNVGETDNNEPAGDGAMAPETDNTSGSSNSGFTKYGTVYLDVDNDVVELEANFASFPQLIPVGTIEEQFRPVTDSCEVLKTAASAPTGGENVVIPGIDNLMISFISAGEVLTISSPAGSYAELIRSQQFGFTFYSTDEAIELSAPVPNDLSISIPGDEFPAFSNIAIPNLEPLQVSSPGVAESITANTSFSWTGSSNPNSFVEVFAISIGQDFSSTILECVLVDDGSFAFSADTKAELGEFSGIGFIDRTAVKIVPQGDSILIISAASDRVN